MTTQEFSNEFDVLYNNIMSNQAPGLNEYEKSVFLTKAQDEVLKNHFNAKGNPMQDGFDDTAKRQIDFSSLLFTKKLSPVSMENYPQLHPGSSVFKIEANILMIVNESLKLKNNMLVSIIPVAYTDIANLLLKPYKYPPKNQAWRYLNNIDNDTTSSSSEYGDWVTISETIKGITTTTPTEGVQQGSETFIKDLNDNTIGKRRVYITGIDNTNKTYKEQVQTCKKLNTLLASDELVAEIITSYDTDNCDYVIRYVKRPNPIILADLDDNYGGLSIAGYTKVSECELDKSLHTEILQRAVELAKVAYVGDINSIVELGKRSE